MCLNCHVVSVDVEIRDFDALKQACDKLGYKIQYDTPHKWYGRWADDSPVPRHLFATDAEHQAVVNMPREQRIKHMGALLNGTQHSVVVPGNTYSIGLVKVADHYRLAWDNWRGSFNLDPLTAAYATQATKNEAMRNGHSYIEQELEDGSVQLRIQVTA